MRGHDALGRRQSHSKDRAGNGGAARARKRGKSIIRAADVKGFAARLGASTVRLELAQLFWLVN
jgi:hypothetical protein